MIVFDFQIDDSVLTEDAAESPATSDSTALEQTFFSLPARFAVNKNELLGSGPQGAWYVLPLLGFATSLGRVMDELNASPHARMYLAGGGELRWTRADDTVHIESTLNQRAVVANAAAMKVAVEEYVERVRCFLEARFPQLDRHPRWSTWFAHRADVSA